MGFWELFKSRKIYEGDIVDLKERYRVDEKSAYDGVPTVYYDVLRHADGEKVGTIDLRLTVEGKMYYYGHIGYNIQKAYRGNGYAYQACRVLFKIAREEFGMACHRNRTVTARIIGMLHTHRVSSCRSRKRSGSSVFSI